MKKAKKVSKIFTYKGFSIYRENGKGKYHAVNSKTKKVFASAWSLETLKVKLDPLKKSRACW